VLLAEVLTELVFGVVVVRVIFAYPTSEGYLSRTEQMVAVIACPLILDRSATYRQPSKTLTTSQR
jgi:hypothetical protein